MEITVLTLFPEMFAGFLDNGMVKRAIDKKAVKINLVNIRDFTDDNYNSADDYPYGGGAGMVLKPEPLYKAIKYAKAERDAPVIYFTPQGKLLKQRDFNELSKLESVILLCGHYKDIDFRIREAFVDMEVSIGDYVVSGGELPAMIFIDGVARLQKGVLNNMESALTDSHQKNIFDAPYYTRPAEFMGMKVPDVLLSGNHKKIEEWRRKKALELTKKVRPDLLKNEE